MCHPSPWLHFCIFFNLFKIQPVVAETCTWLWYLMWQSTRQERWRQGSAVPPFPGPRAGGRCKGRSWAFAGWVLCLSSSGTLCGCPCTGGFGSLWRAKKQETGVEEGFGSSWLNLCWILCKKLFLFPLDFSSPCPQCSEVELPPVHPHLERMHSLI